MLIVTSCASSQIENGFEHVKTSIKNRVYDPDSLIFNYVEGILDIDSEKIYYKVNYNAKNRFGGYVGSEDYYYVLDLANNDVNSILAEEMYRVAYNRYIIETNLGETNIYYEKITFN